jgi:hypothetical protein
MSILASTDKYKSKRQLTRLPRLSPIAMRLSVICCQPSATLFAIGHSLPSIERKDEILEAHRSGISIHRIAQIFREPNVDISTQHLMRAIWLFIEEGEGTKGKTSVAEATGTSEKTAQKPVTYQVPEPFCSCSGGGTCEAAPPRARPQSPEASSAPCYLQVKKAVIVVFCL